jgi:cysteine-rich repeat protein
VLPNQILRVITKFEDYKGKYPYHCHIIEHEDHEMMRQFQSVLCGDAVLDPSETCDDGGTAGLDGCGASCDVEEFVLLGGTASGGSVSVNVGGASRHGDDGGGADRGPKWRRPSRRRSTPKGSRRSLREAASSRRGTSPP